MIPGRETDAIASAVDLGTLASVIASVQTGPRSGAWSRARDQQRTARLLFDRELTRGEIAPEALLDPAVLATTRVRAVPPRPLRIAAQIRRKLSGGGLQTEILRPLVAARRAVLGPASASPPRFLVRIDEYPHARAWAEPERFGTVGFKRFHEIMAGAGVPYLLAVLPRVSREPLSLEETGWRALEEGEVEILRRIAGEGVTMALHGRDHRTRFANPSRHSELGGLSAAATAELLDSALADLAAHEIRPRVFVPPYNRFDAGQYGALAERFAIVCGGPESIGTIGLHGTPQWRGDAVYLPAYEPFYDHARAVLGPAEEAIEQETGLWTPIVLHWGWELQDGWRDLERLAERIAGYAASWEDFLASADRSAQPR